MPRGGPYPTLKHHHGAVSGTITDPSGAILPSATVTLVNTATGDTQSAKRTLLACTYFRSEAAATTTVTVEQSGFRVAVAKVTVTLGQTARPI